jgi:hypothetical protein
MALRTILRGNLDIERIPLRRCPSITTPMPVPRPVPRPRPVPEPTPVPAAPPCPPFCRYAKCKHPDFCKGIGICHVDWEPEFVKQ